MNRRKLIQSSLLFGTGFPVANLLAATPTPPVIDPNAHTSADDQPSTPNDTDQLSGVSESSGESAENGVIGKAAYESSIDEMEALNRQLAARRGRELPEDARQRIANATRKDLEKRGYSVVPLPPTIL